MAVTKNKGSKRSSDTRSVVANARGRAARPATGKGSELLKSIAIIVAFFFGTRIFLVEAYHIPSESMEPTLLVGDFLFVNKAVYGAHLPFTNINLPGYAEPKRGTIAVYESPEQHCIPNTDCPFTLGELTPIVVKRIVGLPGDTVFMRGGLLYVNGIAQRLGFDTSDLPKRGANDTSAYFAWQRKFALTQSRFGSAPTSPTHDDWGPLVIPPAHYLTMGDNRYDSIDGRYYGFVPRKNLRGQPLFIYFSVDFYDWRIRWNRIGHVIH